MNPPRLPWRVLLVENVADDALLVASSLRMDDVMPVWERVETEAGLRAALAAHGWDIVISDYFLPSLNAIEALRVVREVAPHLPVIVVCSVGGERTAVEAMRAGARDFFIKGRIERLPLAVEREVRDAAHRRRQASDAGARAALQQRLYTLMEDAPLPIWIKDDALRYVYANPALCALTGRAPADLLGRTEAALLAPDEAGVLHEQDSLALRLGTAVHSQHELRHPRKGARTLEVIRFALGPARAADPDRTSEPEPARSAAAEPLCLAGVAIDITERLSAQSRLQEANLRLQRLSGQVIEVQERERKRLAQDLHDDIGQSLTALKITLDSLARHAPMNEATRQAIADSCGVVAQVIGRIRSLSLALRPPQLDDFGLSATLRFHVERQAALGGLELAFEGDFSGPRPHPDIENTCFRIVQEVLNNILKHARATHVRCTLADTDAQLKLTIRDDGRGFDVASALRRAERGDSCGLLNMRERAALVGGAVTILSWPNEGTCLEIVLPKRPPRPAA